MFMCGHSGKAWLFMNNIFSLPVCGPDKKGGCEKRNEAIYKRCNRKVAGLDGTPGAAVA